jgi:uncharacterized protein (TIGR02147 family)
MNSPNSIYRYDNPRQFLLDYVATRKEENPRFSLRKWAKEMEMPAHSLLIMILQGRRALTLRQAPFLAKGLNLTSPEKLYFQALIQFENAPTEEEKDLCRLWLSDLNPGGNYRVREIDEYIVIAHWVHMAILAMTDLKNFTGTAEEIHERLNGQVNLLEVRAALERLKSLGLTKFENGKMLCTYQRVTSRDDVLNRGAREHAKQVAKLAAERIDNIPIDRREFQSFALSVPDSKIKLAKEMIRKFRTQFTDAMDVEPGDSVFQMNIHFFQLTDLPLKIVSKEEKEAVTAKDKAEKLSED